MAVLTKSGRAALADAIRQQPLHLAWGEGSADWDADHTVERAFGSNDELALDHTKVSDVVVTTQSGSVTYVVNTDYSVDAATGTIYRVITGNIPSEATVAVSYHAGTPSEGVNQTSLLAEVGRRTVDEVEFAIEDANGAITAPTGRFSISQTPTNHLFVRTRFDFADAASSVIREQGLFVGSTTDAALPAGQFYFTGAEVTDPGILLMVQNSPALIRQPTSRETYEFVVSF